MLLIQQQTPFSVNDKDIVYSCDILVFVFIRERETERERQRERERERK